MNGGGQNAQCTEFDFDSNGAVQRRSKANEKDWKQLRVNGQLMVGCPDDAQQTPPLANLPGKWIQRDYEEGYCIYNSTMWTEDVTQIVFEGADRSDSKSEWRWEIWYR